MPIKKLQTDDQIISETVAAIVQCRTISKASELLGLERSTVYDRMAKYPAIKEAVQKIKDSAATVLTANTKRAAEVIVEGLDDKRSRYDNAKYILDGMGVTKQKETSVQVAVVNQIKKDKTEFDI